MARRVYLHIGAPKTGTTALQTRLQRNASTLVEHGVLIPRSRRGKRPAGLVFRASLDLTGLRLGQDPEAIAGSFDELVDQVTAHEGTVIVSHEGFVRCDDQAVARAVAELGAGADVHVVYSARELGRQLVSGWVEGLKNGGTDELATHLERARTGDLPLRAAFDIPVVLGRWLKHVAPERIHLVTVPPPGGDRALLWRRFADVMGLQDSWVPEEPTRTNESVGVPEAQLLLALNRALGGSNRRGGPHQRIVRRTVVGQALAGRDSPRLEVPPAEAPWLGAAVEEWIAWLAASGVDVVGDLEELRSPSPSPSPQLADPSAWIDPARPHPEVAEAAIAALAAVIAEAHTRT